MAFDNDPICIYGARLREGIELIVEPVIEDDSCTDSVQYTGLNYLD